MRYSCNNSGEKSCARIHCIWRRRTPFGDGSICTAVVATTRRAIVVSGCAGAGKTGPQSTVKILLDIGDCFRIPLNDRSFAFGQYVYCHPLMGPLVRIFALRSDTPDLPVGRLTGAPLLFPPIFVGLNPPVRLRRWQRIGTLPVGNFEFPRFRASSWLKPGPARDWRVWDGERYENIGDLRDDLRSLEILCVHAYEDVETRILTGKNWMADGLDLGQWSQSALQNP